MAKKLTKERHRRKVSVFLAVLTAQPISQIIGEAEALAETRRLDPWLCALIITLCNRLRRRERMHPIEPENSPVWNRN